MKAYIKNTDDGYKYPEDMKKILDYLFENGTLFVSGSIIEELYEAFSDEYYSAGWMSVNDYILPEFADWLSEIERNKAIRVEKEANINMSTFEIYWDDLTPKKQQELYGLLGGENGNYDVFPIASIDFEDSANENKMVLVERRGKTMAVHFYEIIGGDYLVDQKIVAGSDAHLSGDASYDGWLFYDEDGCGWFPEDFIGR